jgi:hypothetical protein
MVTGVKFLEKTDMCGHVFYKGVKLTAWYCYHNFLHGTTAGLNIRKTRVIAFTRKTKVLYYTYKIWNSYITCMDTIKDLGVQLDSKLHFHAYADYIISQSVRILGLNELYPTPFLMLIANNMVLNIG